MATGRIGVTPTLGVRWSKAPAGGTTSLSGLDDNSVSLVYSVGYEQVYRNGVLLSRTNDYTATNGTTITLVDATIAGDIIEVFAQELVPLTDAISKGQFNAKGALLSATAASTPGVLAVGANDTVLTADSSTSTGLKWATPSSGSMTQLATGTLSGSGVNITGISGDYTNLYIVFYNAYNTGFAVEPAIRFNNNATGVYPFLSQRYTTTTSNTGSDAASYLGNSFQYDSGSTNNSIDVITVYNYSSTVMTKAFEWIRSYFATQRNSAHLVGAFNSTAAINQVNILEFSGNNFNGGTYIIYGVK